MQTPRIENSYCLPLIKETQAEVRAAIEQHESRYHYFEVWLDYIKDLEHDFAASLVARYPHRLIMVFRRRNFESQQINSPLRQKIIAGLSGKHVLTDFDTSHQMDDIQWINREALALSTILSYHNYSSTPSEAELRSVTTLAQEHGAHITKVSTYCHSPHDALRLLSLLLDLREAGRRCVILGMGKHGMVTRVFGPHWGNELCFAPVDVTECSAPGQIPLDKLDSIMQALKY
jgi:3-dehydroquinate dehydratase type I